MCGATPLRSLGRSLQAYEARTLPRVYANILVSRGLREPFRGRWFCSEMSPEGTFHRKRPQRAQNAPQSRQVQDLLCGHASATTLQKRPVKGGKC